MVFSLAELAAVQPSEKLFYKEGCFPIADYKYLEGAHIQVFVVSCTSTQDVMVQLNGQETNEVLDKIDAHIKSIPKENRVGPPIGPELEVCSSCLAMYDGDNGWYRARVLKKVDSQTYRVSFVDYGNVETVPVQKLIACPPNLINYVEGITPCILAGFKADESPDVLKVLQDAICDKDLIGRIDKVPLEGEKWRMVISLFLPDGTALKAHISNILKHIEKEGSPVVETIETVQEEEEEIQVKQQSVNLKLESKLPVKETETNNSDGVDGRPRLIGKPKLICNFCGYFAKSKMDYVTHRLIHEKDFMPYACDLCNYRSYVEIGLAYHGRIHATKHDR